MNLIKIARGKPIFAGKGGCVILRSWTMLRLSNTWCWNRWCTSITMHSKSIQSRSYYALHISTHMIQSWTRDIPSGHICGFRSSETEVYAEVRSGGSVKYALDSVYIDHTITASWPSTHLNFIKFVSLSPYSRMVLLQPFATILVSTHLHLNQTSLNKSLRNPQCACNYIF